MESEKAMEADNISNDRRTLLRLTLGQIFSCTVEKFRRSRI